MTYLTDHIPSIQKAGSLIATMTEFFNLDSYYSNLSTKYLGRPCKYFDQVESTIDVATREPSNTLVLAKEQTKGRGQRTNTWHSPAGCAMGSIKLACRKVSPLAGKLCFLQHIMALTIAKTLEQIDRNKLGKERIKLKWPNDLIYCNASGETIKIGGVLVHSQEDQDQFDVTLSFGLNVLNKEPTICIKDIVDSSDIRMDSLIARIMNNLENHTDIYDENKFQDIKQEYIERCLQINKPVEDEHHGRVLAREVNDDGFLVAEKNGKLCTVTRIVK